MKTGGYAKDSKRPIPGNYMRCVIMFLCETLLDPGFSQNGYPVYILGCLCYFSFLFFLFTFCNANILA